MTSYLLYIYFYNEMFIKYLGEFVEVDVSNSPLFIVTSLWMIFGFPFHKFKDCRDCRLSLWRNFTVAEENYWNLTCQGESQSHGLSCYMPLILMITKTSDLLQHKDIIMYHSCKYFILCVHIYCMLGNFAGQRIKEGNFSFSIILDQ